MGLPLDKPTEMLNEVLDSIRFRKKHSDYGMDLVRLAAGNKYRKDWRPPMDLHENHAHEWRTNMVPNLVSGTPTLAGISSGTLEDDHPALKDLMMAVNGWAKAQDLMNPLVEFADDMQFNWACGIVSNDLVPLEPGDDINLNEEVKNGGQRLGLSPRLHRISPWRMFSDPQSISRQGRRYFGHIWIEDKDALRKEKLPNGKPAYDKKALDAVAVDDEVRALLMEVGIDIGGSGVDRKQVVGYEFYVPETGMVYTLSNMPGRGQKGGYLRAPRPYRGLKSGPYVFGGLYMLPDQTYPVAPLAIIHDLSLEINRHRAQASDDAGSSKKLLIVDGDQQMIAKAQSAMNGSILGIPGFKGAATEVRTGGASSDQIQYIQLLNDLIEKTVGLTANSSGQNTGDTALEADIIERSRSGRVKWCQQRFRSFTASIFRIAAETFWNNPRARQAINHTDPITGETTVGMYEGGDGLKLKIPFEDLQLTIDPYSMAPADDALRVQQQLKVTETIIVNVEMMKTNPQIRWKSLLDDTFESIGKKGAGEKYVDWDMLRVMQAPIIIQSQMMAAQGMAAMQGGVAPGAGGPQQLPPGKPGQKASGPSLPTSGKKRVQNESQQKSAPLRMT